jgi:hypothetical protein
MDFADEFRSVEVQGNGRRAEGPNGHEEHFQCHASERSESRLNGS